MHSTTGRRRAAGALAMGLASALAAQAQDPTPGAQLPTDGSGPTLALAHGVVGIPVIVSTPTIGFGIGAAGAILVRSDSAVPPSAVGAGGLYSTNGSWFVAVGGRARLSHDRLRAMAGVGPFSLHYDFFGVGTAAGNADRPARLTQTGGAGIAALEYRVSPHLYVGPLYRYTKLNTTLAPEENGPVAALARDVPRYVGSLLGAATDYDTRDDEVAPTKGLLGHASALLARAGFGSSRTFDRYGGWVNGYIPLPFQQMLALRTAACGVSGDAPPWELCLYGEGPDLRGYETGRYRDRALVAGQVEWRAPVWGRFGGVAFYGAGGVAPSLGTMSSGDLLSSGGGGARYRVSGTYRTTLGVDYAWAKAGGAFYFRFGDAF